MATIPEVRGKGIGSCMTVALLLEAFDAAYRVGILNATRMRYPVYVRLGFKQYCLLTSYEWKPERAWDEAT